MSLSAQTTVFELVANLWQFLSTSPASIILIKKDLGKCHRFATGSNFKKTQSPPLSSVHKTSSNQKKKRGKMINENALFLEPRKDYDQCIIGVDEKSGRIIYSVSKILDVIVHDSMLYFAKHPEENRETIDHDDLYDNAMDYYSRNIIGSHMGEHEPIYLRDPHFIDTDLFIEIDSSDT